MCRGARGAQREMERRIVAQLLTCMDELNHPTRAEDSLPGTRKRYRMSCGLERRSDDPRYGMADKAN